MHEESVMIPHNLKQWLFTPIHVYGSILIVYQDPCSG
jgi:hypothetical protein